MTAVSYRLLQTSGEEDSDDRFLCFQRRTDEDLIVGGYKVVGSAQRTMRRAVLQHGSILIGKSKYAPELEGIVELTGRSIDSGELAHAWSLKLEERLSVRLRNGRLERNEVETAETQVEHRFGNETWAARR